MINFCYWDIPAALILIGVAVSYVIRRRKLTKQKQRREAEQ